MTNRLPLPPTTNLLAEVDLIPRPAECFPALSESRFGFELLSELGRGAFGRVYLARQSALADRLVVLKVGTHLSDESHRLAQLQHPNVAPVYSFHRDGGLQALCMPYLGPVTLAHVLHRIRTAELSTLNGKALTTAIVECRKDKQPSVPNTIQLRPTQRTGTTASPPTDGATPDQPTATAHDPKHTSSLEGLRGYSYVDAVLWVCRQLADGLTAAHARKIVHSDLKPANVLLGDDGQPMLLDFGVAFDRKVQHTDLRIGGTRPYMAPEHIRSILTESLLFDERSDVYSLGVILFELLTGRLPFEMTHDHTPDGLTRDIAVRANPPGVRGINPKVPWAVESIVRKCLTADPTARYQTAEELKDDLTRQLARRPLRHAANLSSRELVGKWASRNRWVLAVGGLLVAGGGTAAGFALRDADQSDRLTAYQNLALTDRFDTDVRQAQAALAVSPTDAAGLEAAIRGGERALASHRVLDDNHWWESGPTAGLPADRVVKVRERASTLLLDLSRVAAVRSLLDRKTTDRTHWLTKAVDWNRRAELAYPASEAPRAVWTQRAWLGQLAGNPAVATQATRIASDSPLRTAVDHRIEARELMEQGKLRQATALFERATELDPTDFWAAFGHGVSQYKLGRDAKAVAAYDVCAALDPTVPGVYFNRGLAQLRLRQFQKAVDDFTRVIDTKADWADPYLNRATAREGLHDFKGAVRDLTEALDLGHPPTAVLLARSRLHAQLGDTAAAKRDLAAGLKEPPTDERGWITRGVARMPKDATGGLKAFENSLADFDEALALNPRSLSALQLKARVYSLAGENQQSADVLTELLKHHPETLDALSGRAMLHSRLGERAKAHADAEEALRLGGENPRTVYQVAGVYAMTSKTHADDKREAFRLLASALRNGFGMEHLKTDRELDPIRSDPDFSQVVEDAKRAIERRKDN